MISSYQHSYNSRELRAEKVTAEIIRNSDKFICSNCRSRNITATCIGGRVIRGLPMGRKLFDIKVNLHRIRCKTCFSYLTEQLDFIPESKVHYTGQLARTIIELRPEMTIQAIAKHFGLSWNTGITNAFMEGFNNKIRWLNKQAYGYRDIEFLKLKIFDLPNTKTVRI